MPRRVLQYLRSAATVSPRGLGAAAAIRQRMRRTYRRPAPLLVALALAIVTPAPSAATPAAPSASSADYDADLRAYLDSIHWYEHALVNIPHLDDQSNREFFTAFTAAAKPDDFYAKALPVFESYISPKDAHTLALLAHRRPVPPADRRAALESFSMIDEHAKPKLRHVWDALMDDFSRRNMERAMIEVRRSIADMAAHDEPDYIPAVGKVGLPYLDYLDTLIVRLYAQQWNASKRKETRCGESSLFAALAPATLLGQGGFASARAKLDECERALETQEASNDAAYQEYLTKVQAIPLSDQSVIPKRIKQFSLEVQQRAQTLGQMHRQLLIDQRRLVSAMETRRERVQIQDGQPVFDSDDDVAEVNRVVDDIVAHTEAINDFLRQGRAQSPLLRGIDLHDGITPTPASISQ